MNKQEDLSPQEREREGIKKFGFYMHYVPGEDPGTPTGVNIHTHGLPDSFDHPDIQIVIPVPPNVVGTILHSVVDNIRKGMVIDPGKVYDNVLSGFNVVYTWAVENDRDVLRMILPDRENKLKPEEIDKMYKIQWSGTFAKAQGNGFR